MKVLVTGATGYIGGRLVPRLLEAGHTVRVMARDPSRVSADWADRVEVVRGDAGSEEDLRLAGEGMDAAYWLVHAMGAGKGFEERDRGAAEAATRAWRMPLVIYLGGLLPDSGEAHEHLRSRGEVGEILRRLPCTEFRAGPVIGSGSASFEMVRYLTERLPVMVTPKWISNLITPVAVRDVLSYLVAALEKPPLGVVEIGGETLSFGDMMRGYARVRGLRRIIQPVPVLAPTLAARWVQFITPIPNRIAVPLLAGIVEPVTADLEVAKREFAIEPVRYEAAVALALDRVNANDVETRWSNAQALPAYQITDQENLKIEVRTVDTDKSRDEVWALVQSIGGERGWLAYNWAWRLRGGFDRMIGGPGLRRGRRSSTQLRQGEALDFWRVEAIAPYMLRLRAEMKIPGKAWLQFNVEEAHGKTRLVQTATFEPRGLGGLSYWKLLYPIHRLIFRAMARAVVKQA